MTAMAVPVSAAMDATAQGGGPGTFLNWIINGNPGQILKQVTDLLQKASEFAQLYEQLKQAGEQLRKVWRGPASDSAGKKITKLLESFTKIISVVREVAQKLGLAASIIQKAQLAFKSIVSAINPTVAGLMSNPWTYAAAVALSTATSGALKGFLAALGALLKSLGAVELAAKLTTMAEVLGHLEKLVGLVTGKGEDATPAPGGSQPTTLPAKDFTDYKPPALGGAQPGNGVGQPGLPGNGQHTWIPVDPGAPAPAPAPVPSAPPPTGSHPSPSVPSGTGTGAAVSVTVTTGEGSATVTAPSGRDTIVNATVGTTPIKVAIDGDGDGKVSA